MLYTPASAPRNPDITAIDALAGELRVPLKFLIKECRGVERDRYASDRDRRGANRKREMFAAMLNLLARGCRS